jgi:hypothetical protein
LSETGFWRALFVEMEEKSGRLASTGDFGAYEKRYHYPNNPTRYAWARNMPGIPAGYMCEFNSGYDPPIPGEYLSNQYYSLSRPAPIGSGQWTDNYGGPWYVDDANPRSPLYGSVIQCGSVDFKAETFKAWEYLKEAKARRALELEANALQSTAYAYAYAPYMDTDLSASDDAGKAFPLPWKFPYYGNSYETITISTNGFVLLGNQVGSSYEVLSNYYPGLPSKGGGWLIAPYYRVFGAGGGKGTAAMDIIAPWWANDWNPATNAGSGSIYYGRRTDAGSCGNERSDCYIVEWWQVPINDDSKRYTFELKLFPNGDFEFHYMTANAGGPADGAKYGTIGYQQVSRHGTAIKSADGVGTIANGSAYKYTRPAGD